MDLAIIAAKQVLQLLLMILPLYAHSSGKARFLCGILALAPIGCYNEGS